MKIDKFIKDLIEKINTPNLKDIKRLIDIVSDVGAILQYVMWNEKLADIGITEDIVERINKKLLLLKSGDIIEK